MPEHDEPKAAGAHDWNWSQQLTLLLAVLGALVVCWVCLTQWGAVLHGHPAYGALLAVTLLGSILLGWRAISSHRRVDVAGRRRWVTAGRIALLLCGFGWVAIIGWLRPFTATQPALDAMRSDAAVRVSETSTAITFAPTGAPRSTGVFFQPGARVDARAYAAQLRPLAQAGYPVVVVKQPLGIAFTAINAFDAARSAHPDIARWVVGGHSLGGTVASMEVDDANTRAQQSSAAPAVGLLLYASYPASDISTSLTAAVLSISASNDALATPAKVLAAKPLLPAETVYIVIDGGNHAQFGSYGKQRGDAAATVDAAAQRAQTARATINFVDQLTP